MDNKECTIKVTLIDLDGDMESPWIRIHQDDLDDYNKNIVDEEYKRVGVMLNNCLCGVPYGLYVPYRLDGSRQPVIDLRASTDIKSSFEYAFGAPSDKENSKP